MTPDRARSQGADHRLPTTVVPRRYDLELAVDLASSGFAGTVTIEAEAREAIDTVVLHAVDLRLANAWVRPAGGPALDAGIEIDPEHEWVRLDLGRAVGPGEIEIHLDFRGTLGDHLVGLYRSTYERDGTEHALAVTQFESTHARRAFPCFDEPAFKAVFGITLVVDEGLQAVSNAAEVSREPEDGGRVRIHFADTVVMSTYLVAFVVGRLEATDVVEVAGRGRNVPLRVVHLPGQGEHCRFALEVAEAALTFFEDYYDQPYPGDKVDLVAVPDFAFGAMENLGCIVFREVLLVIDPASATPQELQRAAAVINHELAHMWFGDLVTMRWWNGIWLNEAFATFMEVIASDAFRPEWDVWTTFGLARATAFDTDALRSTRPIEYDVVTAEDSEAMFDVLTYEKGCSVVRMLEQHLGPEVFRDGIRAYLRRHAWGNTETTDLWDALEQVSGEPVRRVMDAWILRGGHPLVCVHATPDGVRLEQRRASWSPGADSDPWPVPMTLQIETADGAARAERLLLEGPRAVHVGTAVRTVQANLAGNGFYRTLLEDDLRQELAARGGTPLERFVLLDDTWFAVLSGVAGERAARGTIEVMADSEDDPSVWRRIASVCDELQRLVGPGRHDEVAAWVRHLLDGPARRFPADDGVHGRQAEVAGILLTLAGTTGEDRDAVQRGMELFRADGADPAISAAALAVTAAHADAAAHDEIVHRWRTATSPQAEQRHLSALVAARRADLFEHALDLAGDEVRTQDAPYLLRRALQHPDLGPTAWSWLTRRWDDVVGRFPSSAVPRMLEGIRSFTDGGTADAVEAFLADHPLVAGDRQVRQHVERMHVTVAAARRLRAEPEP